MTSTSVPTYQLVIASVHTEHTFARFNPLFEMLWRSVDALFHMHGRREVCFVRVYIIV